ncbi:MAG TPA: Mut7-C RNAse domain-containing protein [Ramlibacter sp.]|nr:Mut7-C RNAse domain-containing protein [Ramlibacter sp.]
MPTREMTPSRFAADAMLGRLARWLRVLGYDTSYDEALADPLLVQLAADEDRMLLTRDRHLLRELRPGRAIEIRNDDPLQQLRDLVATLALPPPAQLFTRCMLCNAELSAPLPDADALALLPPGVRGIPGPVRQCPACGRVYWHGSHARRMRLALERTLPGWLTPGD